ncbi:MAG: ORF6N domain-containing protein, partial [Kiritimatiellia bacterium]|nr:ORF6N domain-containing protein [Kiritimatiellia bacterium]
MPKPNKTDLIPAVSIEKKIMLLRGQKVLLDSDLAALYGVTTSNLNTAVKRNAERFPDDFMFRLTPAEYQSLR